MTQYLSEQYRKALCKRIDLEASGRNPPPQLRVPRRSLQYGKSQEQVIADIEALKKPKESGA